MPFLTPDTDAIGRGRIRLVINAPADPYFLGILRGVLVDLLRVENYEEHGTATPEQTALEWEQAALEVWEVCEDDRV